MFSKILVPLDGSLLAERALESAMSLAESDQAEIVLLRVPVAKTLAAPVLASASSSAFGNLQPNQALERARNEAAHYLEGIAGQHPDIAFRIEVSDGDAAEVIVDTAAAVAVDLIVMSSHGRTGVSRWLRGSVAERVLGHSPCPVLLVRSPKPFRCVLIALDGSELAESALEPGLEIAACTGAAAILLRAEAPIEYETVEELEAIERGLSDSYIESRAEIARSYLSTVAETYRRDDLEIRTEISFTTPADAILDLAEENGVDLIAMATHGRTGLQRWTYGSVTEKVLRGNSGSMLVVRPPVQELK